MKQLARLGELSSPGRVELTWASMLLLNWAASSSPILAIKGRGRLRGRGSAPLVFIFHLKLVRKRRKNEKIRPRRFHNASMTNSVIVLRPFFIIHQFSTG